MELQEEEDIKYAQRLNDTEIARRMQGMKGGNTNYKNMNY